MLVALLIPLLALVNAKAIQRRDDAPSVAGTSSPAPFHFKTHDPHFFHLHVEDNCRNWKRQDDESVEDDTQDDDFTDEDSADDDTQDDTTDDTTDDTSDDSTDDTTDDSTDDTADDTADSDDAAPKFASPRKWGKKNRWPPCLSGYAIRLEKGIVVATPYKKWYDPKLATFFVDDDTQLYTVSKEPLQLYIDSVTGAFKYTKLGWLPPSAISTSFYHTGNNPLGLTNPSPSYLSWPSTVGIAFDGFWVFCPLGGTGQYQVFVNNANFAPQGVHKDWCQYKRIAAVNANPWKKSPKDYD